MPATQNFEAFPEKVSAFKIIELRPSGSAPLWMIVLRTAPDTDFMFTVTQNDIFALAGQFADAASDMAAEDHGTGRPPVQQAMDLVTASDRMLFEKPSVTEVLSHRVRATAIGVDIHESLVILAVERGGAERRSFEFDAVALSYFAQLCPVSS